MTTEADLNQWLVDAEYAVRGEILDRSAVLQKQLDAGEKLPFEKIVACNIGNPQALGQKPLSFNRQVLSLVTNPDMLDDPAFKTLYPPEVIERAEKYRSRIGGGIGAYTVPTPSHPHTLLAVSLRATTDTEPCCGRSARICRTAKDCLLCEKRSQRSLRHVTAWAQLIRRASF